MRVMGENRLDVSIFPEKSAFLKISCLKITLSVVLCVEFSQVQGLGYNSVKDKALVTTENLVLFIYSLGKALILCVNVGSFVYYCPKCVNVYFFVYFCLMFKKTLWESSAFVRVRVACASCVEYFLGTRVLGSSVQALSTSSSAGGGGVCVCVWDREV